MRDTVEVYWAAVAGAFVSVIAMAILPDGIFFVAVSTIGGIGICCIVLALFKYLRKLDENEIHNSPKTDTHNSK